MATSLGFSDFNMNGEDAELKDKFDRKRKNKTIKNRAKNTKKVEQFLNSMENMETEDSDDETEGLAEFHPPPKPELLSKKEKVKENFQPQPLNIYQI